MALLKNKSLSDIPPQDLPFLYAFAVYGKGLGQTRIIELLKRLSLITPFEPAIALDIPSVKATLGRLLISQWIKNDVVGFELNEGLQWPLLAQLNERENLLDWVSTAAQTKPVVQYWESTSRQSYATLCVFSALMGDESLLTSDLEAFSTSGMSLAALEQHPVHFFFSHPLGVRHFATLSVEVQALLLVNFLYFASNLLAPAKAQYDYALNHCAVLKGVLPNFVSVLAWQAHLRGDQDAFAHLASLLNPNILSEADTANRLSRGDFASAIHRFGLLIEQIKKHSNKRKVGITGINGLLYSLALIAERSEDDLKRLVVQFEVGKKDKLNSLYDEHIDWIYYLATGLACHSNAVQPVTASYGFTGLIELLILYWRDYPFDANWRTQCEKLHHAWQEYEWVTQELDVFMARAFSDDLLQPNWHADRQLTAWVDLLPREAAWSRALTALSQLNTKPNEVTTSHIRLAWLVNAQYGGITLEPREQKLSAKGVWSKGRAVALKRLAIGNDPALAYLSEQDQRIVKYARPEHNYYGESGYTLDHESALFELIGHPQVYWADAPDVRIDIAEGEIALQLKESKGQISLKLKPKITAGDDVVWQKETPTRLMVYRIKPDIRQIAGIIGSGLLVPAQAKPQLVGAITAIAPHIAIHSDLPELAAHINAIPGNTLLYAHLLPLNEGLRLQFLVRPILEGSWFTPGKGAANILGEQDGKTVQVERDLKQEKANLNQVLNHCTALANAESDGQEWQMDAPDDCLELLMQLRRLPAEQIELVWPEGERFRLKATKSLANMKLGLKQQGDWFVVNGEVKLDDGKVLQLRQLLELLDASPGRFLKLGDNDYLALTDSFRKRLEELYAVAEPSGKDGFKVNLLASNALLELSQEVGELEADAAWRNHIAKLEQLAQHQPKVPSTLQATLRDYQQDGFQWLSRLAHWGVGACLADDMGLGKTVQTLALMLERAPQGPCLVVAPTSVALNWEAESCKFAPTLKIQAYGQNRKLEALGAFDVIITSYGLLQQDAEQFAAVHWHTVVLDEAQAIKNATTKRSQAAMALQADFKMIATGTPMENHLGELWNLFRFINPALLGSKEKFTAKYANPIEGGDKAAKQALKKLIQPFMLRRTKTQVLAELPSRTEITLRVPLSSDEQHLYEALRQQAVERLDSIDEAAKKPMQVLAEITKLRRFCCNPKLVMKDSQLIGSKLTAFAEVTTELLENKHKALVFSQFVDHLAIVREWLDQQGIAYQYLDGSTPPKKRLEAVNAFQAGEGDIFLISLKAGGSGLNLTAADYVIHLDPWWNPAVEDQASDRAHRMGQQRPVTIYRLVAEGTIEEQIVALHHNKRDLADSLLEGGDSSGKLGADALLQLLKSAV
ncbi:DEAD/DEAH box helicase [Deefgea salmonis]|uniref:DEAD/DEAH box helicase n=1 Tax=Deefgea salmonis TaxID=2875502 RepID=A0ABS8BHP4_9NEIS|nr:DEAD/DEAH box helicase [Deefgea salmonis]MCB5195149.1 DEAD/DEAH box helicase [Deefgea salmonis]